MPAISLTKIRKNPWRDLELYPLDKDQINALVSSINQHGFFGGVKARPVNGFYEIACGHHRIEAAREAGLKDVDIVIGEMSDDDMIQLMCTENATQKGSDPAAIMNEVQAATKRIAGVILRAGDYENVPQIWGTIFKNKAEFGQCWRFLEEGNGIADRPLARYFGHGEEEECKRTKPQIRDAISALKQSGIYTRILEEIEAEIDQEEKEAEERARDAEERARNEEEKRKAAEKRKKADNLDRAKKNSKKSKENSKEKHNAILDPACAKVFANDHQWSAFKQAITTEAARRFIPKEQQLGVAKKLMTELQKTTKDKGRVGAPFIKQYIATMIKEIIAKQKQLDQKDKEKFEREQTLLAAQAKARDFSSDLNSLASSASKLIEFMRADPSIWRDIQIGALEVKVDKGIDLLKRLKQLLNSR